MTGVTIDEKTAIFHENVGTVDEKRMPDLILVDGCDEKCSTISLALWSDDSTRMTQLLRNPNCDVTIHKKQRMIATVQVPETFSEENRGEGTLGEAVRRLRHD